MRLHLKPKFDEESLAFLREENEGYASVMAAGSPDRSVELLNPSAMEIARLATGEATVEEIIRAFARRHPGPTPDMITEVVNRGLALLAQYGLLTVEPSEAMQVERPELYAGEGELVTRKLDENDFRALRSLLIGSSFPDFARLPRTFYANPYLSSVWYEEMLLRGRLFHQRETFFGTFCDRALEFAMSFVDNRPLKPTATVGLVLGLEGADLGAALKRVLPTAFEQLKGDFQKVSWTFVVHQAVGDDPSLLAEASGFTRAAHIPGEFGPGKDELQYERVL